MIKGMERRRREDAKEPVDREWRRVGETKEVSETARN
jgi:hypothetical protein